MYTVRIIPGGEPFAQSVPKATALTFTGRGIVSAFTSPQTGTGPTGTPVHMEFLVYGNVPEDSFRAWLAASPEDRPAIVATWPKPSPAASAFSLRGEEFLSWVSSAGDPALRNHGKLAAHGVVAFSPIRKAATTESAIDSAIDRAYALLGMEAPKVESVEDATPDLSAVLAAEVSKTTHK